MKCECLTETAYRQESKLHFRPLASTQRERLPRRKHVQIERWNYFLGSVFSNSHCARKTLPVASLANRLTSPSIRESGYGLNGRNSIPGRGKRFVSITKSPDRLWGATSLPIQWVTEALSLGHESDHSPPSSDEEKNVGAIPPLPHTSSWRSA
jgi:hypothetical protein